MAKAGKNYGNESISLLEGAERVRKRPGVIFEKIIERQPVNFL